jgi:hypothetical protein
MHDGFYCVARKCSASVVEILYGVEHGYFLTGKVITVSSLTNVLLNLLGTSSTKIGVAFSCALCREKLLKRTPGEPPVFAERQRREWRACAPR